MHTLHFIQFEPKFPAFRFLEVFLVCISWTFSKNEMQTFVWNAKMFDEMHNCSTKCTIVRRNAPLFDEMHHCSTKCTIVRRNANFLTKCVASAGRFFTVFNRFWFDIFKISLNFVTTNILFFFLVKSQANLYSFSSSKSPVFTVFDSIRHGISNFCQDHWCQFFLWKATKLVLFQLVKVTFLSVCWQISTCYVQILLRSTMQAFWRKCNPTGALSARQSHVFFLCLAAIGMLSPIFFTIINTVLFEKTQSNWCYFSSPKSRFFLCLTAFDMLSPTFVTIDDASFLDFRRKCNPTGALSARQSHVFFLCLAAIGMLSPIFFTIINTVLFEKTQSNWCYFSSPKSRFFLCLTAFDMLSLTFVTIDDASFLEKM